MSLSQAKLQSLFLQQFIPADTDPNHYPADMAAAADRWMKAYDGYAQDAQDASGDSVTTKAPQAFKSAIAALPGPSGTAAGAANVLGQAFVAYWTGAVFAIGAPPPAGVGGTGVFASELASVVTAVVPTQLSSLLQTVFASTYFDASAAASALATAFHTATTSSVTVLINGLDTTPPPSGPLPITNTGPIH